LTNTNEILQYFWHLLTLELNKGEGSSALFISSGRGGEQLKQAVLEESVEQDFLSVNLIPKDYELFDL
jgi:hypothetical protein